MQRVLAEDSTQRFAERTFASAGLADEYDCSLRLLCRVLHGPSQPIVIVAVDALVARSQHFEHVLAQQAPIAGLRLDPPTGPQIELAVDDAALVARLENHAAILPPLRMRQ